MTKKTKFVIVLEKVVFTLSVVVLIFCVSFIATQEYYHKIAYKEVIVNIKLNKSVDPLIGMDNALGKLKAKTVNISLVDSSECEYEVTLKTYLLPEQIRRYLFRSKFVERVFFRHGELEQRPKLD